AIQIIEEGLRASLDRKAGGDIAKQLDSLYDYMCQRLLAASVANDPAPMAEISKLLADLRETWSALAKRPAGQAAASAPTKPLQAIAQAAAPQAAAQPAAAVSAPAQPAAVQPAVAPAPVQQAAPQAPARQPLFKQAAAAYATSRF